MAIYHLSASIIKRSAGRSVTAAAAYRAAVKIEDFSTGLTHDYTRKKGVDYSVILSPISTSLGNEWLTSRQELWNKVEEAEKQKNAQLAREVTIALPRELPKSEQIALVREYVQTNYVAAGMIADVNLHHLDGDNPHAHILLSMRNLQTGPEGVVEFGLKNRDWNSKELLLTQRKSWEEIANKYLAASGSDLKIDCRSLKDQGSEFIPQIHVGVHAMAMKRKGIATDRSEEFERIEAENNLIRARLEQIYERESAPEPELELKPELTEQQQQKIAADRKLAELIIQVMPIDRRETQTFGTYRIKPHQNKFEVRTNNCTVILKLELKDDTWIKSTCYPVKSAQRKSNYSHSDIDAKVDDFAKTIENHLKRIDELKIEAEAEKLRVKAEAQARQAERQRVEAEARAQEIERKRAEIEAKIEAKMLAIEERKLAKEQRKIEIEQRKTEQEQARIIYQARIFEERKLIAEQEQHQNNELGRSLDLLLQKWGQRVFFPENINLVFSRYRHNHISVYTDDGIERLATRVYSLVLANDNWIDILGKNKDKYSADTLITLVDNQHRRFDTGEIKKLELNHLELRKIHFFEQWRGLELNDYRLANIRESSIEIITTDLAKYLAEWIDENIPKYPGYLENWKEENGFKLDNLSHSIIFIKRDPPNSVYIYYTLLDTRWNQSLKIRYNRDRPETISGVITPLISEAIKNIINDSESIVLEQTLISSAAIDINIEPTTPLLNKEAIVIVPNFFEKVDPNNKLPILRPATNPINLIHNALTTALEKEPKPTMVQASTVIPIPILLDPQPPQLTEIIITTPDLPIIQLDPIDINLELVTPLPDKKTIKQQAKKKPNRGFER